MKRSKLLIIGGAGDASQFIREIFESNGGYEIYVIDQRPKTKLDDHYFQCDLTFDKISSLAELIYSCDVISICLPLFVFIEILPKFVPYVRDGTLLIDTFSVKSKYIDSVLKEINLHNKNIGILSLHPLFKPELGIKNNNIIASQFPSDFDCDEVYLAIEQLGGHVIKTNDNDKLMSLIQIVPHSLILLYGLILKNAGIPFKQIKEVSTPPVQHLLYLLSRILSGTPKVYWEIQHENSNTAESHAALLEALQQFSEVISNKNEAGFTQLLQEVKEYMSQEQVDTLSHRFAQILHHNPFSFNE
jgi:prephenate dehydrogenase